MLKCMLWLTKIEHCIFFFRWSLFMWTEVWKHHGSVLQYFTEVGREELGHREVEQRRAVAGKVLVKSCGWQGVAAGANDELPELPAQPES
jgi:hypothetical protein